MKFLQLVFVILGLTKIGTCDVIRDYKFISSASIVSRSSVQNTQVEIDSMRIMRKAVLVEDSFCKECLLKVEAKQTILKIPELKDAVSLKDKDHQDLLAGAPVKLNGLLIQFVGGEDLRSAIFLVFSVSNKEPRLETVYRLHAAK